MEGNLELASIRRTAAASLALPAKGLERVLPQAHPLDSERAQYQPVSALNTFLYRPPDHAPDLYLHVRSDVQTSRLAGMVGPTNLVQKYANTHPYILFHRVMVMITLVETMINLKFGQGMFPNPCPRHIMILWSIILPVYVFGCLVFIVRAYVKNKRAKHISNVKKD